MFDHKRYAMIPAWPRGELLHEQRDLLVVLVVEVDDATGGGILEGLNLGELLLTGVLRASHAHCQL